MNHLLRFAIVLLFVGQSIGQTVKFNQLPATNGVAGSNIVAVWAGAHTNGLKAVRVDNLFSNVTVYGWTTNIGGMVHGFADWTAGAGATTYRTNTLFTVGRLEGQAALLSVDLVLSDLDLAATVGARQTALFYWDGGGPILRGAVVTNLTHATYAGGVFYQVSGTNVLIKAWAGDEADWTGRASIQILNTP